MVAARGRHLLPLQLGRHGLTVDHLDVTDEAVGAVIRGYTREAGVWGLATALGDLCAKVVRRRAEGDTTRVEVTPETVVDMLGAPRPAAELAGRTGCPGAVLGLYLTAGGGGDVSFVETSRMPGAGALTLTGLLGESMQETARTAMSWLRANAGRYGLDPSFHRDADVHLHLQANSGRQGGTSAGVAMVAALVSAFTGRPARGDLAMTGEIALSGEVRSPHPCQPMRQQLLL